MHGSDVTIYTYSIETDCDTAVSGFPGELPKESLVRLRRWTVAKTKYLDAVRRSDSILPGRAGRCWLLVEDVQFELPPLDRGVQNDARVGLVDIGVGE